MADQWKNGRRHRHKITGEEITDLLTPQQWEVLRSLVQGDSYTVAARKGGTKPAKVAEWATRDLAFRDQYREILIHMREATLRKVELLVANSLAVVVDRVQKGDAKAAFSVLRAAGVLTATPSPEAKQAKEPSRRHMLGTERVGLDRITEVGYVESE